MQKRGHDILITASKKEISYKLLDSYNFKYESLGSLGSSLLDYIINIPLLDIRMFKVARKYRPDIFIGFASIRAAHVSKIFKKTCINLDDTEHAKWIHRLYVPFSDVILTPLCFKKDFGIKQIRYNGITESSHLHPRYFKPNPKVLDDLGIKNDDVFFILRFSSFTATHDLHSLKMGQEYVIRIIKKLEKHGRIIIFSESNLDDHLKKYACTISPEQYHDLLYYSHMYIGEGSTTAEEAGILGTPSLHFEKLNIDGKSQGITPFIGVIEELQNKFGLLYTFHNEEELIKKVDEFLIDIRQTKKDWNIKKRAFEDYEIDLTQYLADFVERYDHKNTSNGQTAENK